MDLATKREIGTRLRMKREQAGYTREKLGELASLSPRFIANVELGESTFSLDSLMSVCRLLSCSSDFLLFGSEDAGEIWIDTLTKVQNINPKYKEQIDNLLQSAIEIIAKSDIIKTTGQGK